jgi:hypothetical protein
MLKGRACTRVNQGVFREFHSQGAILLISLVLWRAPGGSQVLPASSMTTPSFGCKTSVSATLSP